jgi:hypothetical protein
MSLARRLIFLGAGLIVLSAIITVVLPAIGYSYWNAGADQSFLVAVELLLRFVGAIVPPLGASLLAAGIVVFYLEKKSAAPVE